MEYGAIDLHLRNSQICIVDDGSPSAAAPGPDPPDHAGAGFRRAAPDARAD
jgi:hypothetical protein